MCPKSRNRKQHKVKSKIRTEEVKKQQTAFKNRLMEQFKQKQLDEMNKNKVLEEKVEAEENLKDFAI